MAVGAGSRLCLLVLCWVPLLVEGDIKFADFNIERLGKTKMGNMPVVQEIVEVGS